MSTPWRDNLEALTMAIVMALLLKGFIVEAYKIPSGSMQPTLIGDELAGIEDRILVDKLSYAFRAPERWDVAVFRYPLDQSQHFVKRIVGVGPEELRIDRGDLWRRDAPHEPWTILRRPARVMESHWKQLDLEAPETSSWDPVDASADDWTFAGRSIDAPGPGRGTFRRGHASIMDRGMDGYPEELIPHLSSPKQPSGLRMVGDLRVEGVAIASAELETLVVELKEGLERYRFEVPGPAAPADAVPRIACRSLGKWRVQEPDAGADGTIPLRLVAGQPLRFAVQNLDDRLRFELDGMDSIELDVEPVRDQDSSVSVELLGGGARLEDLMVYRDLYYLGQNRQQVSIPAGEYFMLGDNTHDSSDGRAWQAFRYRVTEPGRESEGLAGTRVLMGNHLYDERDPLGNNPRTVGLGDPDGPRMRFVDTFGEVHWYPRAETQRLGYEPAPFVPRTLIAGRALFVFWPLDPRRDVYRFEWVH